jgi:alpha-amylase
MHPTTTGRAALLTAILLAGTLGCGDDGGGGADWQPGQAITLDVSAVFSAGTALRDHASGATATVGANGKVTVTPDATGLVLLERDGAEPTPFRWDAATVYFAITDRFQNGDPSNDGSYGRTPDGADEIGTWHGGDLKGLTARLDHIEALGTDAIWISPPVEQVHGWAAGGSASDFKHYGYHGYWALDFTRLDRNFGTEEDLRAFVNAAHARGLRVVFDVVMNHPGYATGADLVEFLPEVIDEEGFAAYEVASHTSYSGWHNLVSYGSSAWPSWWGTPWIRAGLGGGYTDGGSNDLTRQLSSLPDFKTESTAVAGLPPLLARKAATTAGSGATEIPDGTVRDYLVKWHTDWVRTYGIDGFRCDTVKHVELESWKALKDAGLEALDAWQKANPNAPKPGEDLPFWTVGEVFPHGVVKDAYFTEGRFDSLLNFEFQADLTALLVPRSSLLDAIDTLEETYSGMAGQLSPDPAFDVTTYLSSHDTDLFFRAVGYDVAKMRQAGTALLLAPGSVQIFYGDESGRRMGPGLSEALQGTRSDMNWDAIDASILGHFQKVGTFRKKHAAIGAGAHARLESPAGTYAFSRTLGAEDAVVVVITPPAS